MLSIILIYLVVSVVSGVILMHFVKTSEFGWEDERGFHFGNPR